MKERINRVKSVLGLAWIVAVMGSYYTFSHAYYAEKVANFLPFFKGVVR